MNPTHTPGPWFSQARFNGTFAVMANHQPPSPAPQDVAANLSEANARLIAAAPDMLAALESAWQWALLNQKRAGTLDVRLIAAAIDKARGQS